MNRILTAVTVAAIVGFPALAQSVKFAHAIALSPADQASAFCDTRPSGRPNEVIEETIINGRVVAINNGKVGAQDSDSNGCERIRLESLEND